MAFLLLSAATAGCSNGCEKKEAPPTPFSECDAGDAAFVRNATLAVLGRRPLTQLEVGDALDLIESQGRPQAVQAMIGTAEFVDRWSDHFMDALRVPRVDDQDMRNCFGARLRDPVLPELATYLRNNEATALGDGSGPFTMGDLLAAGIAADDLSPVYRAHLFAMVAFPIPAANVPRIEAELARRDDFGRTFDAAYLNRDLVCLSCHNSEFAVTYSDDPAQNRHWPMPGHFERSIYGSSAGIEPDPAHAVFRFDGFVDSSGNGPDRPWGWAASCGTFDRTLPEPDPAGIDGKFGDITGALISVYDLEASLKRGVDALAADGLVRGSDGTIEDPDQAFACLVAATIVEGVWTEMIGSRLTIANYFPRNEPARDVLVELTDRFVASHFSLRQLVADITASEFFNRTPPESGCGEPYDMPNIFDPWVIGDDDPARRKNSSADGVAALSPRVLLRSAHAALERPFPGGWNFPETNAQYDFYRGIGVFMKSGEHGFRGLDFQARLVWEERYGSCANPTGADDFIDRLVADAATGNARLGDVVLALKDRLVNEGAVEDGPERDGIEELFGASLDTGAADVPELETRTRRMCGILLSSPQFLLGGFSSPDVYDPPLLNR